MRVLLIDDHPLMLDALGSVVSLLEGIDRAERATTLAQAISRINDDPPYALHIVDMALPDAHGTEGVERLRLLRPDVPVAVFTGNDDPMMVSQAIEAGARGYILKNTPADTVLVALRMILRGGTYVPAEMVDRLMATVDALRAMRDQGETGNVDWETRLSQAGLGKRQTDVLRLLCRGMPNKLIEDDLYMAEGTVKSHVTAVYKALGVHNRAQAILKVQAMLGNARYTKFTLAADDR